MTVACDVLIAGAGIIGASCAWELAKAGLRVAVVDENFPSSGATGASMGHVVAMDDSEAQFALTRYSQTLWNALQEELPQQAEFDDCGTIWIGADEEEMAEVQRKHVYYAQRGTESEILDARALAQAEPNLREGLAGGLLVRSDSVVYPPGATAFFLSNARKLGAKVYNGKAIMRMGEGTARLADGSVFQAAHLVNAAGPQASRLTPGIQVKPRKGHLVITDRYPGLLRHQLVELGYLKSAHSLTSDSVAFNVQPRKTGQILIGSSRQYDVENPAVEPAILSKMMERAFEYLPVLKFASAIRAWTGFRPATPDKLPLIGPWTQDPTVLLATGHEGLGITTSMATAKLVRAHILKLPPPIPAEPYLPSRQLGAEVHA